jgi:hypothetical protein
VRVRPLALPVPGMFNHTFYVKFKNCQVWWGFTPHPTTFSRKSGQKASIFIENTSSSLSLLLSFWKLKKRKEKHRDKQKSAISHQTYHISWQIRVSV